MLFLSCKHENQVCYERFFEAMKTLPVVLYNLLPFVPTVVGSDRARAIVNAREKVFPDSRSVLCWIHMDLYRKQGKFAKHMSSTCTIEERARIENDIVALHEMRSLYFSPPRGPRTRTRRSGLRLSRLSRASLLQWPPRQST